MITGIEGNETKPFHYRRNMTAPGVAGSGVPRRRHCATDRRLVALGYLSAKQIGRRFMGVFAGSGRAKTDLESALTTN